jgi:cytochrome c556
MQDAFAIVLFVVVGVGVVAAIASLFVRGRLYDDIGRGGLSIDRPRADPRGAAAERDDDIRQMLEARNARRAARGEAPVDVEAELAALTRPPAAADPEIVEEVRSLVRARNNRRIARGEEPLDVEAEVERQLRDLPG